MHQDDSFIAFQNSIGQAHFDELGISPVEPWLLELNIDPQDAVLEVRRYLGDPKSTCCRLDHCLFVSRDEHDALHLRASDVALEDLHWWPVFSDWQARRRAKQVTLPFASTSLQRVTATAEGDFAVLNLRLIDATGNGAGPCSIRIRLGVGACQVVSERDDENQAA